MTGEESEATYWQARARALDGRLTELRNRMVALVAALPREYVELLQMDAASLSKVRWRERPVSGIENTHTMVSSDVETELSIAWQRLRR